MNDLLALLAEISVGFTGFAAIVSALGNAPGDADSRLDRLRLRNLVETGVVIVVMATLPLVLLRAENGSEWAWTVSAVLLSTVLLTFAFLHGRRNRAAKVADLEGYNLYSAVVVWMLGLGSLGVLAIGLLAPHLISVQVAYVTALWLLMTMLGWYFMRIAASLLTHKLDAQA